MPRPGASTWAHRSLNPRSGTRGCSAETWGFSVALPVGGWHLGTQVRLGRASPRNPRTPLGLVPEDGAELGTE